jgi:hypothetical protein
MKNPFWKPIKRGIFQEFTPSLPQPVLYIPCQYPNNQDNRNRTIREIGQQPADQGEQAKGQLVFLQ